MAVITTGRVVIGASAEAAWQIVGDYAHDPTWREGVSRMQQTPPGFVHDGATVVEEQTLLGRHIAVTLEVHDVVEGQSYHWRTTKGQTAWGSRVLTALDDGRCEFATERHIELTGADRLVQPLVGWVMQRAEQRNMGRLAALVVERSRTT